MSNAINMEKLFHALDHYVEARRRLETEAHQACCDWDCGIANDLAESFPAPELREELECAKQALETELDDYVDSRIEVALCKRFGAQGE